MSELVYLCFRENRKFDGKDVIKVGENILPDNINPNNTQVLNSVDILAGVYNPVPSIQTLDTSVCLGNIIKGDWYSNKREKIDGSYAIFRDKKDKIELITDAVASRTIWYVKKEDVFVAGTSQRAIIHFLRDFKFNEEAMAWMLSSGNLGPYNSWDERINMVPPDSKLVLDKNGWEIRLEKEKIDFNPKKEKSKEKHKKEYRDAVEEVFENYELTENHILPISGGFDSRCILLNLLDNKEPAEIDCFTHGYPQSIQEKGTDPEVAKRLCEDLGVNFEFIPLRWSEEPVDKVMERFVLQIEGRLDHFESKIDGIDSLAYLFNKNKTAWLRGDVGFTVQKMLTEYDVERRFGLSKINQKENLKQYLDIEQSIPKKLERNKDETISMYRDRIYHQFRIPVILGSLSENKLGYSEVENPLLSKRIIEKIRELPDSLRDGKKIHKDYIKEKYSEIGFEDKGAEPRKVLRKPEVVNVLKDTLNSEELQDVLPEEFLNYVKNNIETTEENINEEDNGFKEFLGDILPWWAVKLLSNSPLVKHAVDENRLAFRIYIIWKMRKQMEKDAEFLNS